MNALSGTAGGIVTVCAASSQKCGCDGICLPGVVDFFTSGPSLQLVMDVKLITPDVNILRPGATISWELMDE